MSAPLNLVNQNFGRLKVLKKTDKRLNSKVLWKCKCICGQVRLAVASELKAGKTVSCGCWKKEKIRDTHTKHGLSDTVEYAIWGAMHRRCEVDPNYKERGIRVCTRWSLPDGKGFINFLKDMGPRPKGLEIDRRENDRGYRKSNCHWTTRKVNLNNTRQNYLIEFKGKNKTLAQWSEKTGISRWTIRARLERGWSARKALTTLV